MPVFLVTYDLKKPGQDYSDVLKFIRKYPNVRLSESSYAIQIDASAENIVKSIRQYMDQNDFVYVIALHRPYSGFGPQNTNDWLESNLTSCK